MVNKFIQWCQRNHIILGQCREMFFVHQQMTISPDFVIGSKKYVKFVKSSDLTTDFLSGCELFSQSHGTLILIPIEIIDHLGDITKVDLEERFNISL